MQESKPIMNIIISLNKKYLRYATIMLMSLVENNKDYFVNVYILNNELDIDDLEKMDSIIGSQDVALIPIHIDRGSAKLFARERWPEEAAYRLMAVDIFGENLERALYLDADILIAGSLKELYEMNFEDNYLVVCEDMISGQDLYKRNSELGRSANTPYFNSGVLLMNIRKLYNDNLYYNVFEEMVKQCNKIPFNYPDQDLLNIVFTNSTKFVSKDKYNYMPGQYLSSETNRLLDNDEILSKCCVIHYCAGAIPWGQYGDSKAAMLWWSYAKNTPYYYELQLERMENLYSCYLSIEENIQAFREKNCLTMKKIVDNKYEKEKMEKIAESFQNTLRNAEDEYKAIFKKYVELVRTLESLQ